MIFLIFIQKIGFRQAEVKFTYPKSGDVILSSEATVQGIYKNVPANKKIWIFVYSYKNHHYYPQKESAYRQKKNEWASIIYFISGSFKLEKYDLIATLVDTEKEKLIVNNKLHLRGFPKLPDGIRIYDQVSIIKKYEFKRKKY